MQTDFAAIVTMTAPSRDKNAYSAMTTLEPMGLTGPQFINLYIMASLSRVERCQRANRAGADDDKLLLQDHADNS